MIKSGRRLTVAVVGSYWISCRRVVLVDHLAPRHRDVLADTKRLHIGHLDRQPALAAFEILEQVPQPVDEVLTAAFDRRPEHLGVGHQEVRRGDRIDELPRVEIDLARGALVDAFDILDRSLQPARRQQVALLDEVEQRVVGPRLVAEATVPRRWFDHRLRTAAEKPLSGALPQRHVVVPQRQLSLNEARRVRHHMRRHLKEGGADAERVGHADAIPGGLPLEEFGDEIPALLGDVRHLL